MQTFVIVGSHAIGKSSYVAAWLTGTEPGRTHPPTIGADHLSGSVVVGGGPVKTRVWDVGSAWLGLANDVLADGATIVVAYDSTVESSVRYLARVADCHGRHHRRHLLVDLADRPVSRPEVERALVALDDVQLVRCRRGPNPGPLAAKLRPASWLDWLLG